MIRARMVEVIRIALGETDPSNSYWSDAEIVGMISESQIQVVTDAPHLLTFKEMTTTASDGRYALPVDFLQLKAVEVDVTATRRKKLNWISFDEFAAFSYGNFTQTGEPHSFKMELGATDVIENHSPGDLWLWPLPDAAYTLRVYFFQRPSCLTTGMDESELARSLHWAVCYHAAAMLSLKNDDRSKFTDFMALYDKAIFQNNKMMNQANRGVTFTPKDTMGYTEGGW